MLEDFISFNGEFHKSVKKLLKYIEINNPSKKELDELRDQFVENAILNVEEKNDVKEINKFKSIEEIKKYLEQAVDEFLEKSQQVASEHNYSKPRSKMYDLRERTSNMYNRDCSCCNSR